jgi:hypothetical protein
MSIDVDRRTYAPSAALAEAARVAGFAPSLHNTQPWRWQVNGAALELYADPIRQLTGIDPGGRLMVLSCGAALHHARIALAAQGLHRGRTVGRPGRPRLLARLTVSASRRPNPSRYGRWRPFRSDGPTDCHEGATRSVAHDMVRTAVEAEQSLCVVPADGLPIWSRRRCQPIGVRSRRRIPGPAIPRGRPRCRRRHSVGCGDTRGVVVRRRSTRLAGCPRSSSASASYPCSCRRRGQHATDPAPATRRQ